jgi:ankyrin repeat protein
MNVLKKSLLVSTALLLGAREIWAMETPPEEEERKCTQIVKSIASQSIGDEEVVVVSAGENKQVVVEERQNIPPQQIAGNVKQPIAYPFFSPEHTDYVRLLNIRYLIENQDKLHPIYLLRNLSWQVDGMQVLKRSFRDRTTTIVPIWSLLAYLHNGLVIPELSAEFQVAFVHQLLPLLNDIPKTLADLESFEVRKSLIRERMKQEPQKLARDVYKSNMKQYFEKEDSLKGRKPDDFDLINRKFFLSIAKTPIDEELRRIQECSLFTHEYRFEESLKSVENYMQSCSVDVIPATQLRQSIRAEEQQLSDDFKLLEKKPSTLMLQKLIGVLYEYQSLQEAHKALTCLEQLDSPDTLSTAQERRVLFQTLTVLGEAFNNILTPLDIDPAEDILSFIPSLKYIRNTLEHPEGYKQQKFENLLTSGDFSIRIWQGLRQDLLALKIPLEKRIGQLRELITSKERCEDKLIAILGKEDVNKRENGIEPGIIPSRKKGNQTTLLLQQSHWMDNGLRYVQWLRRYFYHPTYGLVNPENEVLMESARDVVKVEGKPKYSKPKDQEKMAGIDEIIGDIRELTQITRQFPTRRQFVVQLNEDRALRYGLANLANQIYFKLNRNIEGHHLEFYYNLPTENREQFESIFEGMKDRRNYSIHDLWREDVRGLGTLLYIRLNLLQSILESTSRTDSSTPVSVPAQKLWKKIHADELSLEELESYVAAGGNINLLNEKRDSLLAYLVDQGDIDLIDFALEHGADPNLCNWRRFSPIHAAAEDGRIDIILKLVEGGGDPDAKDIDGLTPEDYARRADQDDCVMHLQAICARYRGDKADKLHRNLSPLWFQEAKVDPVKGRCPNLFNADGRLPVVIAIEKSTRDNQDGVFKVVNSLVNAGANVNQRQLVDGQSSLIVTAQYSRNTNLLLFLLSREADVTHVDNYGWSALHHAAQQGKNDFVNILLDNKASLSIRDRDGRTPLLVHLNTSRGGDASTVELLLSRGANPNDKDLRFGMTALDYAMRNRRGDICEILKQWGAVSSQPPQQPSPNESSEEENVTEDE